MCLGAFGARSPSPAASSRALPQGPGEPVALGARTASSLCVFLEISESCLPITGLESPGWEWSPQRLREGWCAPRGPGRLRAATPRRVNPRVPGGGRAGRGSWAGGTPVACHSPGAGLAWRPTCARQAFGGCRGWGQVALIWEVARASQVEPGCSSEVGPRAGLRRRWGLAGCG